MAWSRKATSHYLNQWWFNSGTHIWDTRGRSVWTMIYRIFISNSFVDIIAEPNFGIIMISLYTRENTLLHQRAPNCEPTSRYVAVFVNEINQNKHSCFCYVKRMIRRNNEMVKYLKIHCFCTMLTDLVFFIKVRHRMGGQPQCWF